jgi:cobalt-zinc-cadmium resistance protein CzcA
MLEAMLNFSVRRRWIVLLVAVAVAAAGVYSFQRLPIDAVPDITNNQVQVNVSFPALSPVEMEKQVTFVVETALSGIPGLQSTRSLSRNGFSQITAVFEDDVDIYFARQQVSERLQAARESLPPGADPRLGPIATGLGEIYMHVVEYAHPQGRGAAVVDGRPGWQSDGSYLTPEGHRLTTELERAAYLREVQDWIIRPQLRTVKGVAGVEAIGGYVKQYHVRPDPMRLVSYGLSFHDVIEALERNNVSTGAGYIEHKGEAYVVRATGRIATTDEIESVAVGARNGVPIYVRDVVAPGGVGVGRELRTGSASRNGEEVVVATTIMLIGSNSRTVAAAVDQKMAEIQRSLPPDVVARTVLNRTKLVDATIATVRGNLLEGAIFVIAVLLLLLGNLRAALICAAAIPLSMLMTTIGMVQSRVSGNLMSLGAIDFGLIVDGAVIIVENCLRRLAQRQKELGRALTLDERLGVVTRASAEVRSATAFGEAIIIVVYVPILALTGVEGKLFRPMALTVIFALAAAFVLSLTFVPAMVAILVRGRVREKDGFLIRAARAVYAPLLQASLRLRWAVVPAAVALFAMSLMLFARMGQEFVPTLDEKDIAMHAMRIPSTSLTQSTQMQHDVERVVGAIPEVAYVFSKTGSGEMATDPMPPNVSDTFIILKPDNEWRSEGELDAAIATLEAAGSNGPSGGAGAEHREASATRGGSDFQHEHRAGRPVTRKGKLIRLIELSAGALPGNNYEFTQPIQMRFNELIAGVRGDVAVKVFGDDFASMVRTAADVLAVLQSIPGAADAKVEQTSGLPVMTIDIDRAAIARYGLSVADVQDVIAAAMGGREAGLVFEGDRRFDLVVRLPEALRDRPETLENLPIPLTQLRTADEVAPVTKSHARLMPEFEAGFVPLGQLARIEVAEGPNQFSRENGKRRIVVQCNVRGRDLGSFVAEAQAKMAGVTLPPGGWLAWGGQYENLVAARQRLSIVVPICFLLILTLLFSTFHSVRYALLVFSAVPLGLTGGVVALWLRGMPFSISAAVGFIALSGVAVLNGLVMVSFINQLRAAGVPRDAAIVEGSLSRLRPVLMTALVASLGFVPMAVATGAGAEVQRPLATVVIGGLVTSTVLTLVVLPALYRMVTRER